MRRSARMLTAVVAVLVASLAAGAASASALVVKVRVEIKQQPPASGSPYLHGLVDRTPVTLPDADPNPVTVNGVSCNSRSAIAALAKAVPANLWTATGTGSGTTLDKVDGHPGTVANASGAELPSWVFYAGGDQQILDPCTTPLDDKFAGTDVLVYLKCGTGDHALAFECFNGQPLILRALQESPFPTVAINTQFALPVYVWRAPGPFDWVSTQASWTSLIVTDESNIGILVNQIFHDGSARIEFKNPGPHTIVATDFTSKADPTVGGTVDDDILHVPDRIPVCVTNGGDGYCGTKKDQQNPFDEGDFPADCVHNGNDGRCGTPDEVGPRTNVTNLKQGQVFRTKKGPTGIRGTTGVADDPAGLKEVKLRLTRVLTQKVKVKPKKKRKRKRSARKSSAHASAAHVAAKKKKRKTKVRYRKVKRCYYWNEDTLLIERAKRCGTAGGKWWETDLSDLRDTFKADFAMRLPKGTYTLEVQSTDEDGHLDPPEPGRNVIRFVVK